MSEIILHNYPQSPVAEKIRLALGLKKLSWHNVLIPRVPPKPDLVALTGGYRRTPVMQIGADVFCDSQCILDELEKRFVDPTFFPAHSNGLAWGISRWGENAFNESVRLVLGAAGESLPEDFAADRGRLYFGPDWQQALQGYHQNLQPVVAQLRGHLAWLDQSLQVRGSQFIFADEPGLADLELYYFIWFIRGRWQHGPEFLAQFIHLVEWEQRVGEIGHGRCTEMTSLEALTVAEKNETQTIQRPDPDDPQALTPGMQVSVSPDVDGGEVGTVGRVHSISAHRISILRESDDIGQVCVHFPRVGYRVVPI